MPASSLGFASYGMFRERPAYKYTVEHSIYIDTRFRGQGHGRVLLEAIVAAAVKQDYHVMVGGIDASNAVSIKLHESLGFTHCGTVAQAGFKFGRWLDLAFYQRILATPARAGGRISNRSRGGPFEIHCIVSRDCLSACSRASHSSIRPVRVCGP